jgi:hypothetical protein
LPATHLRPVWAALGIAGVVLVAFGAVLDRPSATALALLLLGAAYAVHLIVDSAALDWGAPVFGAGLLLCSELAHLVPPGRVVEEPGLLAARLLRIVAAALVAVAVGAVALAGAAVQVGGSAALTAAAAVAAAAALWLIAWLARQSDARSRGA